MLKKVWWGTNQKKNGIESDKCAERTIRLSPAIAILIFDGGWHDKETYSMEI